MKNEYRQVDLDKMDQAMEMAVEICMTRIEKRRSPNLLKRLLKIIKL